MQSVRYFLHTEADDCKDEISQLMQDTNSQAVVLKNMLQRSKSLKTVEQSCKDLCEKMKIKLPRIPDVSGRVLIIHVPAF